MRIHEAYVDIKARLDKLRQNLTGAGREGNKFARNMESGVGRRVQRAFDRIGAKAAWLSSKFKLVGIAAAAAFVLLAKKSAQAYIALERMDTLFDALLKERAPRMRRWADDFAKDLGTSASQARKFTSTYYMLLKGLGMTEDRAEEVSKGLTKITYAVGIARGLDIEDFMKKIQSGMAGMTQSLLRVGISLKVADAEQAAMRAGLVSTGQKLSEQQILYGRYLAFLEQTKDDMKALEAAFQTTHKELVKQADAWGDLKEAIGGAMNKMVNFGSVSRYWTGEMRKVEQRGLGGLINIGPLEELSKKWPISPLHIWYRLWEATLKKTPTSGAAGGPTGKEMGQLILRRLRESAADYPTMGQLERTARAQSVRTAEVDKWMERVRGRMVQMADSGGIVGQAAAIMMQRMAKGLKFASEEAAAAYLNVLTKGIVDIHRDIGQQQAEIQKAALSTFGSLLPAARRPGEVSSPRERFERFMKARDVLEKVNFLARQYEKSGMPVSEYFAALGGKALRTMEATGYEFFGKGWMEMTRAEKTIAEKQLDKLEEVRKLIESGVDVLEEVTGIGTYGE